MADIFLTNREIIDKRYNPKDKVDIYLDIKINWKIGES